MCPLLSLSLILPSRVLTVDARRGTKIIFELPLQSTKGTWGAQGVGREYGVLHCALADL